MAAESVGGDCLSLPAADCGRGGAHGPPVRTGDRRSAPHHLYAYAESGEGIARKRLALALGYLIAAPRMRPQAAEVIGL